MRFVKGLKIKFSPFFDGKFEEDKNYKKGEIGIMKKIIEFLEKHDIEYNHVTLGNPYYYNDGFTVQGITIKFDYELAESFPELQKKERLFNQYMKRRKNHCIGYSGKCGIYIPWYTVLSTDDFERLEKHEARIHADVEKFWKEDHERRVREKLVVAM